MGPFRPLARCGLANCESDQARAKQDKTRNGHGEETVRSEFFTHGTLPIVRPCSNGTTAPLHSEISAGVQYAHRMSLAASISPSDPSLGQLLGALAPATGKVPVHSFGGWTDLHGN
jgi:hypothetical protein